MSNSGKEKVLIPQWRIPQSEKCLKSISGKLHNMLKMNVSYITSSKHTKRETCTETCIGLSIRLLYSGIVATL